MKAILAVLLLGLCLAACGGGDGLSGCTSCHCVCTGATIDTSVQGMPICNCSKHCAESSQCGSSLVSATCVGPVSNAAQCAGSI